MIKFSERFKELMEDNNLTIENIKDFLNLKSPSLVYFWINGTYYPKLNYLHQLSNLFKCSIDYLVGLSNNYDEIKDIKTSLPIFSERLNELICNRNLNKSLLRKQNIISGSLYRSIFQRKSDPTIETLIKLADYLNISIDHLVGRE